MIPLIWKVFFNQLFPNGKFNKQQLQRQKDFQTVNKKGLAGIFIEKSCTTC